MRTALATALALAAAPAWAADAPRRSVPIERPVTAPYAVYDWTGLYLGGNVGYQFGNVTSLGLDPRGIAGGVQAGYNWQTGQFVFGVETDLQLSAAADTFAAFKFSNPWFGTLRGRAGIAMSNVLLYATGGLAYGGGKLDFAGLSESQTHKAWTAGGGFEVGLTPHWTVKAEYLRLGLGDKSYAITGMTQDFDSDVLRLGINYRF